MSRFFKFRKSRPVGSALVMGGVLLLGSGAHAQFKTIPTTPFFNDDFSGSTLDTSLWKVDTDWYGLGRTQYGNQPKLGRDSDGTTFVSIPLQTYNPKEPGKRFWGTQLMSLDKWNMGTGLEYEVRLRSRNLPPGLCLGYFSYGEYGTWPSTYQKTEIDFEFLTKTGNGTVWTNIWDDWNQERGGPRGDQLTSAPGLNWNNGEWNTYRIRWYPGRSEWWANSALIRTVKDVLPGAPQGVFINNWAPDSSWGTPYSSALQPTATASANQIFAYDVDYVRVRTIPRESGAPTVGTGTGLTARYFDNRDFTGTQNLRRDHRVNFDWGTYAPIPSMGVDTFSARWTGQVQAQFSQTYTFSVRSDDGVRLWVNNRLLIDNWKDQGATEKSATISLTAGTRYPIRLEYYDNTLGAVCQLFWRSSSTPKQIIPQSQLYPENSVSKPVFSIAGGAYTSAQNIAITSATSGAVVRYTLDGTEPTATSPALAAGQTLRVAVTTLVRARAFVNGWVPSDVASALYTLTDSVRPTSAVVTPINGNVFPGLPNPNGTASDGAGGSGVARVDVQIRRVRDNLRWTGTTWVDREYGLTTTLTARPTSSDPTAVEWVCNAPLPSGSNLTEGEYEIKPIAYDRAGNLSYSAVAPGIVRCRVDLWSPTVTFSSPVAGATISDFSGVRGNATDWGSGIAKVDITITRLSDGLQWNGWVWNPPVTGIPTSLSPINGGANWNLAATASNGATLPSGSNLRLGAYRIQATAYDGVGRSNVARVDVTIGGASTATASAPRA